MSEQPTRAERLGLEPRSINTWASPGDGPDDREINHSIAISLKRIADALDEVVRGDGSVAVRHL